MNDQITTSFDVFDTCLTRTYLRPIDLFYCVGIRLYEKYDFVESSLSANHAAASHTHYFAEQFAQARVEAERRARRKSLKNDITLEEIYRCLNHKTLAKINLEDVMAIEMEEELQCSRPIAKIFQKIISLRESGTPIIFISDMYLPKDFIQNLLTHHNFFHSGDHLFVSGELGINKGSGKLFLHVLKKFNLTENQLSHLGDNPKSDVKSAKQHGIDATLFSDTHFDALGEYWRKKVVFSSFGQSLSLMVGSFRATRLKHDIPQLSITLASIICNLILPTQITFLCWVIKRCQEENVRALYFVSRAGETMLKVATLLNEYLGAGIDMHYLYGSQQFWSNEDPELVIRYFEQKSLCKGLQDRDASTVASSSSWAIVDLGPLLNNQCEISKLLTQNNPKVASSIRSFNMALSDKHQFPEIVGMAEGYWQEAGNERFSRDDSKWLFKSTIIMMMETLFFPATHSTVVGYKNTMDGPENNHKIVPLFGEGGDQINRRSQEAFHQLVTTATKEWLDQEPSLDFLASPDLRRALNQALQDFFTFPKPQYVDTIEHSIFSSEAFHGDIRDSINIPISFSELFKFFIGNHDPNEFSHRKRWIGGSVTRSHKLVQWLYKINWHIRH